MYIPSLYLGKYTYDLNVYPKLKINDILLCSVTSENLSVGICSLEVVPFLLILSLPQEHAEMEQLLILEIHSQILSNQNNRVLLISTSYMHKYAFHYVYLYLGTIKKITSPSAKPIFHHAASADCPNRLAMRPICFLA